MESGTDTPPPEIARLYDRFLGGKDNLDNERKAFEELKKLDPGLPASVRAHREWVVLRAVKAVAQLGIRQFLDLGSGLPSPNGVNVYDTVRAHQPDARVVYVDLAALPAVHGRALLAKPERTLMLCADARDPDTVLNDKDLRNLIDPAEPVGLIATALVHFWADESQAGEILNRYMQEFPAGYLIFSHACSNMDGWLLAKLVEIYTQYIASIYPRTEDEIAAFLNGLELLEPGLVEASQWRPENQVPDSIGHAKFLVAVGRFGEAA